MDPTHSRPWDARSILDDDNKRYKRLFATRVTNLLEQRQNIYKRALLDELTRLRQLVVSATPTAQIGRTRDAAQTEKPREANFDTSFSTTAVHQMTSLHSRHPAVRNISSSSVVTEDSSSAANFEILNSTSGSSKPIEPMPQRPRHVGLSVFPQRQPEHPSGAMFGSISASLSSPLDINIKCFPVLSDVALTYRYINDMNKNYDSTVSPAFSVTCAATEFSSTEQHQLDPNKMFSNRCRNFHCNPLEVQAQRFLSLPNSLNVRVTDRFSATTFYGCHNVPSLLARLFFQQELELLFDSQQCHTYSTETASLSKATDLYLQQLLPAQHGSSVSHISSGTPQPKLPGKKTTTKLDFRKDHSVKTSSVSPSSVLFLPSEVHLPHDAKPFQRRTFYRSMNGTAKLRAPTAAWRDDKARANKSLLCTPAVQSHHAYAVSSEVRGLPSNINLQGVRSGEGHASVTLAFGFQRRTNYPFRRAYGQPRAVESCSTSTRVPCRVSQEFASRVPVSGLSTTLLHLFQPEVHLGLFFSKAQDGSSLELESMRTRSAKLYAINADGKLVYEPTN